jgi:predicted CoA-binding protein
MLIDDKELTARLRAVKTMAVVGASDKPGRPVDRVGRYLIEAGYTVLPVHPKRPSIWGLAAYPDLASVPVPIDLVNLFRAPENCPAHAAETIALSPLPSVFWMQLAIDSPEARAILAPHPVLVVADRCLMVEHRRLFGGPR